MRLSALLVCLLPSVASAQLQIHDPNFVVDPIYSGDGTIAMTFAPDGKMYVGEKRGRILVFTPSGSGFTGPGVFADFRGQVNTPQESGFLGLTLDPDFANNRYVYTFYTTTNDQRLTRWTANAAGTQVVAGSEIVLLSGLPRNVNFHKAGDIQFNPTEPNNIYIALGDDDQINQAQNTASYAGKLLRVDKSNGQGLSANPFWNNNANSVQSRIWAIGFRNPFRFTFHPNVPTANVLYVSENGNSTDRISWVRMGSNGNWGPQGDPGLINPPDPNHRVLATQVPALLGIALARGGGFADPDNPGSDAMYVANWLFPQSRGSISRWRLTGADLNQAVPFARDGGGRFVTGIVATNLIFGPDGALYTTASGNDQSLGGFYQIQRIRRIGGSPPVARFTTTPSPATGPAPLSVQFNDTSMDTDGSISTWAWTFGDGGTSNQRNPSYVFQNPGTYTAELTVTDNSGLRGTARATITVVRSTQLTLQGTLRDARNLPPVAINEPITIRVFNGALAPIAFPGGTGAQQNTLTVAAGAAVNSTIQVQLTQPEVLLVIGQNSNFREARYGFRINPMANTHTETLNIHLSNTALRGRITDTRMNAAQVDLGVARASVGMLIAVGGGRDYLANSGIPATGVTHRRESDVLGYYYVPLPTGGSNDFYFDVVGDTNRDLYVPAAFSVAIATGTALDRDILLGLQAGGAGCDDLATDPEVPMVDYATQIDPIWRGACTGCHNAASGNSGGLNLAENSYQALVNVPSREVPGRNLITPSRLDQSYLYEKVNCANPQVGTRMRPADPMPRAQQNLIRSWILQGARLTPDLPVPDAGFVDMGPRPDLGQADAAPQPDAEVVLDATVSEDAQVNADAANRLDANNDFEGALRGRGAASNGCGCNNVPSADFEAPWGALALLVLFRRKRCRLGA